MKLLQQIDNEFRAQAEEHQVEFKVFESHLWVKTDKHLLRRILQNLITNAFRYASPGRVVVACKAIDEQLKIQVVDNGPGIPIDKQKLVFEQFTQLQDNKASNGLGLGLNITRSLAQILGHTLSLESEPNQGCNFSVMVPTSEAPRC